MDGSKSIRVKAIAHFVSLSFFSLFSSYPLPTSDAHTPVTLFSHPIRLPYLVLFLFRSLSLISCPSRTPTPIARPRWHLLRRLLIALSQPRCYASVTPIGDTSSPHLPPLYISFLASTPALPPTQPLAPCPLLSGLDGGKPSRRTKGPDVPPLSQDGNQ